MTMAWRVLLVAVGLALLIWGIAPAFSDDGDCDHDDPPCVTTTTLAPRTCPDPCPPQYTGLRVKDCTHFRRHHGMLRARCWVLE